LDAAQVLWRPGSTVKPFLLELLARKQFVGLASQYPCAGMLRVGGSNLSCSHPPLPGAMNAVEALALSCNEFFAHYAALLPVGAFAQTLREAGFGNRQPFGVHGAPAEVEGISQPDAHLLQCLGQQAVWTTPLALLEAFRRLLERMERNPQALATTLLRDGLRACVEAGTGIAAQTPGVAISGKTGTGSARDRNHLNGWFLSYAPSGSPRYLLVVFVEGGGGGADAAPAAGAVWKAMGEANAFG
jgi:cell division protein FtsI/penicillin-binding protein 2